jgi:ferredoxin
MNLATTKSMANRNEKNAGNVPGPFYVDSSCIDCDLCRETAPDFFSRNDETGLSVVFKQPVDSEEFHAARAALNVCPTESIGEDGAE